MINISHKHMADYKFLTVLFNWLGGSTYIIAFLANLQDWKGGMLFVGAVVFGFLKFAIGMEDLKKKKLDNDETKWKNRHHNEKDEQQNIK